MLVIPSGVTLLLCGDAHKSICVCSKGSVTISQAEVDLFPKPAVTAVPPHQHDNISPLRWGTSAAASAMEALYTCILLGNK
jgi:hypothetical protein